MKKIAAVIAMVLLLTSCASLSLPEDAELTPSELWVEGSFVDELGFKTGDKYISSVVYGKFSNSATTDSSLFGKVLVYTDSMGQPTIRFELLEYGSYPVTIIGDNASFASATEDGERLSNGYAGISGRYIMLYNQNATSIIEALARGENVIVAINDRYSSSYRFMISGSGFGYRLQQFLNQ